MVDMIILLCFFDVVREMRNFLHEFFDNFIDRGLVVAFPNDLCYLWRQTVYRLCGNLLTVVCLIFKS